VHRIIRVQGLVGGLREGQFFLRGQGAGQRREDDIIKVCNAGSAFFLARDVPDRLAGIIEDFQMVEIPERIADIDEQVILFGKNAKVFPDILRCGRFFLVQKH